MDYFAWDSLLEDDQVFRLLLLPFVGTCRLVMLGKRRQRKQMIAPTQLTWNVNWPGSRGKPWSFK